MADQTDLACSIITDEHLGMATSAALAPCEVAALCRPVFEAFPVVRARLFGSLARGEGTSSSDVDLCVELGDGPTGGLPALARLAGALENRLGRAVDLVAAPRRPLRAQDPAGLILSEIERDGVVIYERSEQ